jgi:hypothetical protein
MQHVKTPVGGYDGFALTLEIPDFCQEIFQGQNFFNAHGFLG